MKDERDLLWDDGFDAELETLIGPPPDTVVREISPWRKAMKRILTGIVLTSVNLNFWMLNYILPFAGVVLLLLGFRTLRRENGWFRAGWIAAMVRVGWTMFTFALNACVLHEEVCALPIITALGWGFIGVGLLIPVFLWNGMRAVQDKAGIPGGAGAAFGLVFWHAVLYVLALVEYGGWVIGTFMIVAFVLVIRSVYRLSQEPEEAGYAVRAAAVRVGDRALALALCAVLAAGIACGYLFFQRYPMDWREFHSSADSETVEARRRLLELGFPTEVLADLTEEDILACRDALRVVARVEDHPMNSGRRIEEVETRPDGSTVHHFSTVYDVEELRMTHVAVELPGAPERWKIFHHFLWTVNPGFVGTESILIESGYYANAGWNMEEEFSGQVLYDRDGQTWAAPFRSLEAVDYTAGSVIWGSQTHHDTFAAFSLPNEGERQRAYVSYCVYQVSAGWLINAWADYTHQDSLLQYPVLSAAQWQRKNGWGDARPFRTAQGQLLFYTEDGRVISPVQTEPEQAAPGQIGDISRLK